MSSKPLAAQGGRTAALSSMICEHAAASAQHDRHTYKELLESTLRSLPA